MGHNRCTSAIGVGSWINRGRVDERGAWKARRNARPQRLPWVGFFGHIILALNGLSGTFVPFIVQSAGMEAEPTSMTNIIMSMHFSLKNTRLEMEDRRAGG